jgi:ribose 5-phosphate isomerase
MQRQRAGLTTGADEDPARAAAGFQIVSLDGTLALDVAVDSADQIDRKRNLIKGHGGALLRDRRVGSRRCLGG